MGIRSDGKDAEEASTDCPFPVPGECGDSDCEVRIRGVSKHEQHQRRLQGGADGHTGLNGHAAPPPRNWVQIMQERSQKRSGNTPAAESVAQAEGVGRGSSPLWEDKSPRASRLVAQPRGAELMRASMFSSWS